MDDTEGGLSFDFEGGMLDAAAAAPAHHPTSGDNNHHQNSSAGGGGHPAPPASAAPAIAGDGMGGGGGGGGGGGRRSFRQTVCRHWLRSLCMKGEACGFLHQYDKARMPVCRFFRLYGECREQDCVYKHTNDDIKECNMYKLGFCPNGPDCRYRHAKLPGPPPPVEEVLQKIQQLTSYYGGPNKFYQPRGQAFSERPPFSQNPNAVNQGVAGKTSASESGNPQQFQQQQQGQHSQQQVSQSQIQNVPNGLSNPGNRATPLPQGTSRYFIVKSCNRENLEVSVQQGVWATQRSNEAKLNEALDTAENVILIFSVNRTRHFQGCAKMTSKIGAPVVGGNWKYQHGTAHYGRNFSVKWLKLCELTFHKTRHLRNPYNENLPVKISRDCQELEPSVGEQLASLLYLEPDSELMAIAVAAEAKREEEKAKGVSQENGGENPDIVPFEDNEEEEEEEESDEEEESFDQGLGAIAQGRGRGRGMMWPPHMPMARGARPMPGMRGFPPMMMGADGFSYGNVPQDNFGMQDLFGMGPRGFPHYGPRFPGDFTGPAPGMMFPGRPPQPVPMFPGGGFGMMMGPGRPPFMGANPLRGNRPGGMPFPSMPMPPSQNSSRPARRDQREAANRNNTAGIPDGDRQNTMEGFRTSSENQFKPGASFQNDESESEDEAPRRSRHGEGKKKRRGSEEDAATPAFDH